MLKAKNRDKIFRFLCYVLAVIVLVVCFIDSNVIDLFYIGLIILLIFSNIVVKCFK